MGTTTKGMALMQAIRRHQAAIAEEKTRGVEYLYWRDKNFRVISRPGNGMVRLLMNRPGNTEQTRDVPERETYTAKTEVFGARNIGLRPAC